MSNEYLVYDTDGTGWVGSQQTFDISDIDQAIFLKSAGLSEDVLVYQMVGVCKNCAPSDVKWEIVYRNGTPITLGPDNNGEWIMEPGKYSIGDPNDPPEFSGDVNITAQRFKGVDTSSLGKSSSPTEDSPLPVEIMGNACETPLFVELCSNMAVEFDKVNLGCIEDEDGGKVGVVILETVIDEVTGSKTTQKNAHYTDGTSVENYSGPWAVCSEGACTNALEERGLRPDWL